jgi:Flp pilus assembly protein TadD
LEKNETEKAIELFKLNVLLNPEGWNTYDCLAEAYLKSGNKEFAIKNYKKSLELNPKNDNAIKVLEQIK